MKKGYIASIITAAVIALFSIFALPKAHAQGYGAVSFDVFYDELSPYGFWDNDPHYGEIWFPNVHTGFRPYSTNGHWVMTEYGNTWVSNYAWGWAPFHYGRWVYTSYRGWGWIPGYEWGPAWVEWRSGNGYYGWAPMMPRVGVHVSVGIPVNLWIFAPTRHIFSRNIYRYAYVGRTNIYNRTTIINNTYIVNNHHYYGGPSRRDMERTTGRRVTVHNVRQSERPGATRTDRRSVSIYRPDLDHNRSTSRRSEGTSAREVRSNDRSSSSRTNQVETRRNDNRQSTDVNRTNRNRTTESGRANDNSTPRRELHIDREGRATMRESGNETRTRQAERTGRNETRVSERQENRPTERQATRPIEQRQQPQVQRNEQTENRSRTQNRDNVERNTPPASAPQRQERSNSRPERTQQQQPTRQRPSTPQVQQSSSSRSSGSSVTRQSAPRVERSSSATRSSGSATSSGRSGGNSERSSSGRR